MCEKFAYFIPQFGALFVFTKYKGEIKGIQVFGQITDSRVFIADVAGNRFVDRETVDFVAGQGCYQVRIGVVIGYFRIRQILFHHWGIACAGLDPDAFSVQERAYNRFLRRCRRSIGKNRQCTSAAVKRFTEADTFRPFVCDGDAAGSKIHLTAENCGDQRTERHGLNFQAVSVGFAETGSELHFISHHTVVLHIIKRRHSWVDRHGEGSVGIRKRFIIDHRFQTVV